MAVYILSLLVSSACSLMVYCHPLIFISCNSGLDWGEWVIVSIHCFQSDPDFTWSRETVVFLAVITEVKSVWLNLTQDAGSRSFLGLGITVVWRLRKPGWLCWAITWSCLMSRNKKILAFFLTVLSLLFRKKEKNGTAWRISESTLQSVHKTLSSAGVNENVSRYCKWVSEQIHPGSISSFT